MDDYCWFSRIIDNDDKLLMKNIFGTIGFFITSMVTFRLVYGSWPPTAGNFKQWISSDPRALWAMAAAVIVGMLGALIGRAFVTIVNKQQGRIGKASEYARRGFRYHKQRKMKEAIEMFKRSIEIYTDFDRINDAAPIYGSLGKVYFDNGDLDLAEDSLKQALTNYARRSNAQEAIDTTNALLQLISERKQNTNSATEYNNMEYDFSFTIPIGWLKQKLVKEFLRTGGQVAISHKSHKATFNVSVGEPDRKEWITKGSRADAVRTFLAQTPGRIGAVAVTTAKQIGSESNTVCAEYMAQQNIKGVPIKRKNGFISIIRNGIEYAFQWSAVQEYEDQVKMIIASFRFGT